MQRQESDFLVIGSGLAGLFFALKASRLGHVIVLSKDKLESANTPRAQGGIAAVLSEDDSFRSHIDDTLRAGAGLCHDDIVRNYVEQAPDRIKELIDLGVQFDRRQVSQKVESAEATKAPTWSAELVDAPTYELAREGGHSHRRVIHAEDLTGAEVHRVLLERCREQKNIQFFEDRLAIDLIVNKEFPSRCLQHLHSQPFVTRPTQIHGAYVLDRRSGEVESYLARATILATGGAGKVYLYTSNWSGASGDGVAMAWRAGARVANLEFMQFHPTCLYHTTARNFLISEALRGEGGELINARGEAFMKKHHEMGSLAPRDIVARSIDQEMKQTGAESVFLDMTRLAADFVRSRFPAIYQRCLDYGIDITKAPIPVVPAAHYLCGGIVADVNGQTDLRGLWALGETACTGFHGANRLASNSLLECLAMAHNCARQMPDALHELRPASVPPAEWIHPPPTAPDELIVITQMWEEIRRLMWNYVGIVRSNKRLARASARLKNILAEVREYYLKNRIHSEILELRNIAIVADLSVECALRRQESRGIHYNIDHPWATADRPGRDTVLTPGRT
ncbi:MAG: L-aspartate oxidase [Bdellovibrio sp.]|nr:MAG: L-aspartate oxidase [Bdellovibrio sp.]